MFPMMMLILIRSFFVVRPQLSPRFSFTLGKSVFLKLEQSWRQKKV